jgi:carbon storage regulator
MLVLSRKVGERILIGEKIEIVLSEIDGNRVRIGVEAPPEVSIRRAELPLTEKLPRGRLIEYAVCE